MGVHKKRGKNNFFVPSVMDFLPKEKPEKEDYLLDKLPAQLVIGEITDVQRRVINLVWRKQKPTVTLQTGEKSIPLEKPDFCNLGEGVSMVVSPSLKKPHQLDEKCLLVFNTKRAQKEIAFIKASYDRFDGRLDT